MRSPIVYLWQIVAYALFYMPVYYLSTSPGYHYLQPDQAELKLAFKHAGKHVQECHQRSEEELRKLPPNMRKKTDCSRERAPISIEIMLDQQVIAKRVFNPPGIHRDGTSFVYARFAIPSGEHQLAVNMQDRIEPAHAGYQKAAKIALRPGQVVVVGFDENKGGFQIAARDIVNLN